VSIDLTAAVTAAAPVLGVHRWKSMGVASVECECGDILYGDESADEAFREHLARAAVEAAAPLIEAAVIDAVIERLRKFVADIDPDDDDYSLDDIEALEHLAQRIVRGEA
jgi:hypothetical protein